MRRFTFLILCLFFLPTLTYGSVSQFVFTTEIQSIALNSTSSTITIQSQNSSGTSEDVTETTDVVFTSTSSTGKFLSTSGNPVSTTMSKNTANKNFLYIDSTSGNYILTVTFTGRTTLSKFSASQEITVGSDSSINNISSTTTSKSNYTETNSNPTVQEEYSYSAHGSPASLNDSKILSVFEISAGRNRLTSVGNEVTFKAIPIKFQNISEQSITYTWSFGDGVIAQGLTVNHVYKFPGEYSVILNASASDRQAVSRTSVLVISPTFKIEKVLGGLEISNKSNIEINLEGWTLSGKSKNFIFPKDTIISAGKKVIFADEITGIQDGSINLLNPIGKIFASISLDKISDKSIPPTSTTLNDIQTKIDDVKLKISKLSSDSGLSMRVIPKEKLDTYIISSQQEIKDKMIKASSSKESNVATIFEAKASSNFVESMFFLPIKGFNFIKHLFTEE